MEIKYRMEIKYLVKGLEKKVEYTLKKNKIRMKGKGGGKYNKNIISNAKLIAPYIIPACGKNKNTYPERIGMNEAQCGAELIAAKYTCIRKNPCFTE